MQLTKPHFLIAGYQSLLSMQSTCTTWWWVFISSFVCYLKLSYLLHICMQSQPHLSVKLQIDSVSLPLAHCTYIAYIYRGVQIPIAFIFCRVMARVRERDNPIRANVLICKIAIIKSRNYRWYKKIMLYIFSLALLFLALHILPYSLST